MKKQRRRRPVRGPVFTDSNKNIVTDRNFTYAIERFDVPRRSRGLGFGNLRGADGSTGRESNLPPRDRALSLTIRKTRGGNLRCSAAGITR